MDKMAPKGREGYGVKKQGEGVVWSQEAPLRGDTCVETQMKRRKQPCEGLGQKLPAEGGWWRRHGSSSPPSISPPHCDVTSTPVPS